MNKTKLILATLITLAMLVPMVSAAPNFGDLYDNWLLAQAEEFVNEEYTDHGELDYTGEVVSGWKGRFLRWNKQVELNAEYEDDSFYDLGTVTWNGLVFWYGECDTITYVDTKPTQRIIYNQDSVYLDLDIPTFWDGKQYRAYEPICYRNDGSEPMQIHFTLFGYDKTYTVNPGHLLSIYTPYNTYF